MFLGAVFNDVNGSQFYDWLSAPGTKSNLLSNLTTLGMGNTSEGCLSFSDQINAIDCDRKMNVTICMRGMYNSRSKKR